MSDQVRCVDCGCLAFQRNVDLELVCAPGGYRRNGMWATPRGSNLTPVYASVPLCAVNAMSFQKLSEANAYSQAEKTRHCDHFTAWQPALNPREHIEMRQLQEQREFNRRMIEEERQWREQQAAAERDWAERDRKERAEEAARVEQRYQADVARAERDRLEANKRFWIGFGGALVVTVVAHVAGQVILGTIQGTAPPPTINVVLPAGEGSPTQPASSRP